MLKAVFLFALVALCSASYMSDGAEDEYSVRVQDEDDTSNDPHVFVRQVRPR
jgi:hypothetical protein